MLAACVVIVGLFVTNSDMGGDPASPRGDGKYRPVLARGDGHMLYLMARSTALDGDWVFDNDLARFGDPWSEPITRTGRKSIVHPIGPALVWTPMIWIAEGGAWVADEFGASIPLHGYTLWHQRIVFLSSVLFACGAALFGRRLAKQVIGGTWAPTYAACAVLLGTPLTYYASVMPSYMHAMDAFACAAFLLYWAESWGRDDIRRWIFLGALLGIAALVRVQEFGMGVVVVVEIVVRGVKIREPRYAVRLVAYGAVCLAVAVVVFIPQFLEWHYVFGSVTELPQGHRFTRFSVPMIAEVLFSSRNGWFSSHPIAYLSVLGLFMVPRKAWPIAGGLLAALVLQVYLNSTIVDWWASASFGQRRLCSVTFILVIGLAGFIWRLGKLTARLRRVRPGVWHLLLFVVLGVFVQHNLRRIWFLRGGKAPTQELTSLCCDNLEPALREIASPIYGAIGDPFTYPASILYSWKHDVPITSWDRTVGRYPIEPGLTDLTDQNYRKLYGSWDVGSGDHAAFLVAGWSGVYKDGKRSFRFTTTPAATVLVPNLLPGPEKLALWLLPAGATHVTLWWNDRRVADADLRRNWTRLEFSAPNIETGTNELTIEAGPAPFLAQGPRMAKFVTVGVGVGDLELRVE